MVAAQTGPRQRGQVALVAVSAASPAEALLTGGGEGGLGSSSTSGTRLFDWQGRRGGQWKQRFEFCTYSVSNQVENCVGNLFARSVALDLDSLGKKKKKRKDRKNNQVGRFKVLELEEKHIG